MSTSNGKHQIILQRCRIGEFFFRVQSFSYAVAKAPINYGKKTQHNSVMAHVSV